MPVDHQVWSPNYVLSDRLDDKGLAGGWPLLAAGSTPLYAMGLTA